MTARSTTSSSIAIAESSLTLALPPSLSDPPDQPRYQSVGRVAPSSGISELVQPEPHLCRLCRPGLPRVVPRARLHLHLGEGAPNRPAQEHGDHGVDRIPQFGVTRHGLFNNHAS